MSGTDMAIAVVGDTQGVYTAGDSVSVISAGGQAIAGVVSAVTAIGGAVATNPAAELVTSIKIWLDTH